MPLAGIMAGAALMERWPNSSHGTTFGGNPVSCAAAKATVEVLEAEGCYARASVIGETVIPRLRALAAPAVVEVRGIGAMIGVELRDQSAAADVQARCLAGGVIVRSEEHTSELQS